MGVYNMEKIRTTVRVAGRDYTLTSYDSEAHVQRVAGYVDRKLNELSTAFGAGGHEHRRRYAQGAR